MRIPPTQDEPPLRGFSVDVMPMEGKSRRNRGGVRLVFCRERHWPGESLRRVGCKRAVHRLQSTPEIEAYLDSQWRAHSLIYRASACGPAGLEEDLKTLGVAEAEIAATLRACEPFWKES